MKVADYNVLGEGPTPKEIKRMRKESLSFHLTLGQPVIFKHRWNLDDLKKGRCTKCPYLDDAYHRDKTDCEWCFGTGFLGGFADGVITYVTIADAPVDQLKIGPQGYILFDKHPILTAPWTPEIGDGDLIILADFDRATWEVLETKEIFELNQVEPVSIRGLWGMYTDNKIYKIQQTAKIDKLPSNHVYYSIPIVFSYENLPVIIPPVGAFSEDYPENWTEIGFPFRISGAEGGLITSSKFTLNITGAGTDTSYENSVNITGKANPSNNRVVWD